MRSRREGFTLVETLIALVLSSLVIVLVSSTFLAQNRAQATQAALAAAHDNVRAATDLVARELRSSMRDGILVAGARTLTVRSPVAVVSACGRSGFFLPNVDVHVDGGVAALATDEIAGVAVLDEASGAWDYQRATWGFLNGGSSGSAGRCAGNGADTLGVADEFHSIRRLLFLYGLDVPDVGEVLMLFREVTFRIGPSALEPGTLALFRQPYGGAAVEFASGMDSTSAFRYRIGGGSYQDTVTAGSVGSVDGVRLVMNVRRRTGTGPDDEISFGIATNLLLRNVP